MNSPIKTSQLELDLIKQYKDAINQVNKGTDILKINDYFTKKYRELNPNKKHSLLDHIPDLFKISLNSTPLNPLSLNPLSLNPLFKIDPKLFKTSSGIKEEITTKIENNKKCTTRTTTKYQPDKEPEIITKTTCTDIEPSKRGGSKYNNKTKYKLLV